MKKTIQQELKNLNAMELINFVSDKYYTAEKRNLPSLNQCFQFMPQQDMTTHPELITIRSHFNEVRKQLQRHLADSAQVNFPEIRTNTNNYYIHTLHKRHMQPYSSKYLNHYY